MLCQYLNVVQKFVVVKMGHLQEHLNSNTTFTVTYTLKVFTSMTLKLLPYYRRGSCVSKRTLTLDAIDKSKFTPQSHDQ